MFFLELFRMGNCWDKEKGGDVYLLVGYGGGLKNTFFIFCVRFVSLFKVFVFLKVVLII